MNKALAEYKHWRKKHYRSIGVYILINMTIFIMLASTAVLNLWALKYGTNDMLIKIMFITMAAMAAFGSFVNGIIAFFNYKRRAQSAQEKIGLINNHWQWYQEKKVGMYDSDRRDINLLENVTEVLNKD